MLPLLNRLNKLYNNDSQKVKVAIQHLADADREKLRLLLQQKAHLASTFALLDRLYAPTLIDNEPYKKLEGGHEE